MRGLFILIVGLGTLYSGYWLAGRVAIGHGLANAEAEMASQGTQLDYAARNLAGFPSRFDITYRDPALSGPGWQWQAPLLQVFTLAYKPNHMIAFAPGPHEIEAPQMRLTLNSEDARASLRLGAQSSLPLREMRLDITAPALSGDLAAKAERLFIALRDAENAEYDLSAHLAALSLPELSNAAGLPGAIEQTSLQARLTLSAPLDRKPQTRHLERLTIDTFEMRWGEARLTLSGTLERGPGGLAEGSLDLTAENAELALSFLIKGLPAAEASRARLLWQSAETDGTLKLIFTIRAGQAFLGPIPLAALPALP